MCELAAKLKAAGQTLHEKLDSLFWQHGLHVERTVSVQMPGSEGMERMKEVMAKFRTEPMQELAGAKVKQMRDYENMEIVLARRHEETARGSQGRSCDSRPRRRRQLRGDSSQRDRAEDQTLHVHLRTAGATREPRPAKEMLAERLDSMEADMRRSREFRVVASGFQPPITRAGCPRYAHRPGLLAGTGLGFRCYGHQIRSQLTAVRYAACRFRAQNSSRVLPPRRREGPTQVSRPPRASTCFRISRAACCMSARRRI